MSRQWAELSISVITAAHNSEQTLGRCLESLAHSTVRPSEHIVVDDGSSDGTAALAERYGARVLRVPSRQGPAHARNVGAEAARGDLLLFLDSDVCIQPDAIGIVISRFREEPDLDALFGSYDDDPAAAGLVSQYRNLLHTYTHQTSPPEASTFWAACGVIRRSVFLAHGGFDPSFDRPSIEDIELGVRLVQSGSRIALDRAVQVKHLKHWTLLNTLETDILLRGIPWTRLILNSGIIPKGMGLQWQQRISALLAPLILSFSVLLAIRGLLFPAEIGSSALLWIWVACIAILGALNAPFYRFLARKRNWPFAFAAVPLHVLYYLCCAVSLPAGTASHLLHQPVGRVSVVPDSDN
jgi:glycosyltransferase involved in cell wall biosynthesis